MEEKLMLKRTGCILLSNADKELHLCRLLVRKLQEQDHSFIHAERTFEGHLVQLPAQSRSVYCRLFSGLSS